MIAQAQANAPDQVAQPAATSEAGDDVVVTGARIVRDGYDAPTPLTVVGTQELEASAPAKVADCVSQLPSINGTVDVNTIPQRLIKSTKMVTAGASAV